MKDHIERHFEIRNDPADIQAKLCDQALLYAQVAGKAADVQAALARNTLELQARRDRLYVAYRQEKEDRKWSERDIEARIGMDENVTTLSRERIKLQEQEFRLEGALQALRQRYGCLKTLAEMLKTEDLEPRVREDRR